MKQPKKRKLNAHQSVAMGSSYGSFVTIENPLLKRNDLRKQVLELLWEYSYRNWNNGYLKGQEKYEEYPEYLADKIVEFIERLKD